MNNNRLLVLDSFRGIAAISVMIFHYTTEFNIFMFNWGCLGVDLFFITSGFVIFLSVQSNDSKSKFIWNRFSRLYPAYWFVIFWDIGIYFFKMFFFDSSIPNLKRIFLNITMLQVYFNEINLDSPFWTLQVEIAFYVFILIILILRPKKIEIPCFIFSLICLTINVLSLYNDNVLFFLKKITVIFKILTYFPLFFAGILFFKLKTNPKLLLPNLLILFTFITQLTTFPNFYKNKEVLNFIEYSFVLAIIYTLFYAFILNKLLFLTIQPLLFLGKISYSLYLIHNLTGVFLINILVYKFKLNIVLAIFIVSLMMIFISYSLYLFVEKPSIKYLKKLYK